MTSPRVRTRFAPSPTGMLHIGGMRSAIYSWLLARHFQGDFLLRIEDTDQARRVPGAVDYIMEGFRWFGIDIDEGPSTEDLRKIEPENPTITGIGGPCGSYVQSQRLSRYQAVADELIEKGFAFRCDCTPEMLEQERNEQLARKEVTGYSGYCRTRNVSKDTKHIVRFKMPYKASVEIEDGIRGRIAWENIPLRDPILLKSDGFALYHLASVVDDHDMHISHVLRGEEWIPSAPLHVLLYDALGWEKPVFCHLPVVNGSDGKKLSKRHGSTSWSSFRDQGYLPEAVLNFVVLIGWSPGQGEEQEIFTKEELIRRFTLEGVNSSSGVFDYNKLAWMNGQYIRGLSVKRFQELVTPFLQEAGVIVSDERFAIIAPSVQERCKLLTDASEMLEFLTDRPLVRDMQAMLGKQVTPEIARQILEALPAQLSAIESFDHDSIEGACNSIAEKLGIKPGGVFLCLRIAVTGKKNTPPMAESLRALGKHESIQRIVDAAGLSFQ